jgi:hypothetical protein
MANNRVNENGMYESVNLGRERCEKQGVLVGEATGELERCSSHEGV